MCNEFIKVEIDCLSGWNKKWKKLRIGNEKDRKKNWIGVVFNFEKKKEVVWKGEVIVEVEYDVYIGEIM